MVVTGDTIDINNYFLKFALRFFTKLHHHFRDGILLIPGNHDYFDNGREFILAFLNSKITLLRNQVYFIKRGSKKINFLGMDYAWPYHGNTGKRMSKSKIFFDYAYKDIQNSFPTIVLNHHPMDFLWLKNKNIDLVLSGHTHGGQINLSNEKNTLLSPVGLVYKYYKGHYFENGKHLYVNRGLGHSFPVRMNSYPEITVIELI